ncbi:MFS transporter [Streptomyces sp. NBC_01708]|uniref:MFS transporter n=1 Tax=Streptomyces sp. NBC_01708 TaxID=2975915 RepID=UPI003FCC6955
MRTGGGGSGSPPAGRPGDARGGPRGRHRPAPRHGRFALRRRSAPPLRAARVRRSPAPSRRRRLGPRRVQLSARRRAATLPALGRRPGPGAVFADRELAGAFAGLLLLAALLAGFLVYLVQYLQNVQGLDALRSGLAILPFGVALLLTTQGLTRFLSTVDLRIRAMGGLVVVRAGVAWLTLLDGDSTYAAGVLPQIVLIGTGVGVAIAIVPFNTVILATAPAEHAGITAGVLQTALTIGGSVGLALLLIVRRGGPGGRGHHLLGLRPGLPRHRGGDPGASRAPVRSGAAKGRAPAA